MKPHLEYARAYWEKLVCPGDILVDATVGNGYDTFFLAQLLKGEGTLIGYDIQPQALLNTQKKLYELPEHLSKIITLKLHSHVHIEEKNIKLIVYNLGYLPSGNKAITTLTESTLQSLQNGQKRLLPGGGISIVCYPGHQEGYKEQATLLEFLKTLPKEKWQICHHQWLNRPLAPSLIWMQSVPGA